MPSKGIVFSGFILSAAVLSACRGTEPDAIRAQLTVAIDASPVSLSDTLIIRRTVRNLGADVVWFDLSPASPPAMISTERGEPACFLGLSTLPLYLRPVAPGETVEVVDRRPLARLSSCQPGRYRVTGVAVLYRSAGGPPGPARTLEAVVQELVVTPF